MKFTDSHEWIEKNESNIVSMGITDYAQKELGDIVYIELPEKGREVHAGQEIAVLESTKAAADVYAPVTGVIVEVNENLNIKPELVNSSPEKEGWLCKIRLSDEKELDALLDRSHYDAMIQGV